MVSITEVRPGAPTALTGPMLGAVLGAVADQLASILRGLDVGGLSGAEAAGVAETFARVERLGMAGKTLAAGRVAESGYCRQAGFPSPRAWLAHATKASPWEAAKTIQTGAHLAADHLAPTRDALVSGRLTATQANEIAITSAAKPDEQDRLLDLAERETTDQLKAECRKVRLADKPAGDPAARRKRVMEETAFSHRDVGGDMSELFARMPTSVLAMVVAAVRHQCDAVFARARAEGRDDPHQAYMVEALVTLLLIGPLDSAGARADGQGEDAGAGPFDDVDPGGADADDSDDDGDARSRQRPDHAGGEVPHDDVDDALLAALRGEAPPPRSARRGRGAARRGRCRCGGRVIPAAKIMVRVDQSALLRGHAVDDELCDITGVGPVPVATVRELWPDAVVKMLITKGADVVNVTHLGRKATEALATAMQFTSPCCTNIGCDNHKFLEVDHRLGFANVHRTRLGELDGLCTRCHGLKTNQNWQLVAGAGRRRFVPPESPDHPGHPPTPRWSGPSKQHHTTDVSGSGG